VGKILLLSLSLIASSFQDSPPKGHAQYSHYTSTLDGRTWVNWTSNQRQTFVTGYLEGYNLGFGAACIADFDALPQKLTGLNLADSPLQKCMTQQLQFSKGSSHYAEEITTFYEKFTSDAELPVAWLVQAFSDSEHKTLEEVHTAWANGHSHP
jgi:hypothetical protein